MKRAIYFLLAIYALTGSVICGQYDGCSHELPQDFKDAGP